MSGSSQRRDGTRPVQVGEVIYDPVHGETMRFLNLSDGDGAVLRVEMAVEPQASGPPAHVHPNSSETFDVAPVRYD